MRKRRRLANKMTIIVCAVLIAVSTFFYAPMEVRAGESNIEVLLSPVSLSDSNFELLDIPVSENGKGRFFDGYVSYVTNSFNLIDSSFDLNSYYAVNLSGSITLNSDNSTYLRNFYMVYGDSISAGKVPVFFNFQADHGHQSSTNNVFSFNRIVYGRGSDLINKSFIFECRTLNNVSSSINFLISLDISVNSVVQLTGEESASYQQGYNAGYSAGEEAGESNGYSNGYSDGYEAGEQSGYDSGFQAGSDSVDTQSYYDAGYSAGYDAGYSTGYDTGYDEGYDAGWSAYEAQMDKWGADTSDYPILLETLTNDGDYALIDSSSLFPYSTRGWLFLGKFITDLNPSHTYKLVFDSSKVKIYESNIIYSEFDLNYRIGNNSYKWYFGENFYYISGSDMSSSVFLDVDLFGVESVSESDIGQLNLEFDFINVYLYDMGPSGDTQNHIANQTDQLTNGYDDSKGNSVNSEFSTGLNEFETAENSLFATATTGMRDFTFFDFESVPAMITGMSFIGSIMGSWFNQAGGASGVGIVLSILFSVILVAMVLGLYRWYQSRGGKN